MSLDRCPRPARKETESKDKPKMLKCVKKRCRASSNLRQLAATALLAFLRSIPICRSMSAAICSLRCPSTQPSSATDPRTSAIGSDLCDSLSCGRFTNNLLFVSTAYSPSDMPLDVVAVSEILGPLELKAFPLSQPDGSNKGSCRPHEQQTLRCIVLCFDQLSHHA